MENFKQFQIGQEITAKELIGLKNFEICHSTTYVNYIKEVKEEINHFGEKRISYKKDNGEFTTNHPDQTYIVIDKNSISFENNAWWFLGEGLEKELTI